MSLREKVTETNLGWRGEQPPSFEMGVESTLHNASSIVDQPAFSTYTNPYLRTKRPSQLDRGIARLPHYLDNPPR